jgi:serine/threonine protein kinase
MTEQTLFHEALSKPAAERAAFLDAACAGQPELRAAVESLLAAHEAAGSFLDRPVVQLGQSVDSGPRPADLGVTGEHTPQPENLGSDQGVDTLGSPQMEASAVIAGRYTLVEKIGEGGMGEVWVAQQTEPVKRKVALKLIKTGMDSKAVLARFEQERQALAIMDHPNIARVLDGGLTPTGLPFVAMELVNGLPLTKFCDEARLTPRDRLELFVPICQAVQHAHQKGIVHRDLKPANILVTIIDGQPVPKVIDFGVAKAVEGKITDEELNTQFGAIVGTLEYMSPEQAGFSGQDIDTRADIYSLGVILYELLTGLRPIDVKRLKKAGFQEMIRVIQEEEPSKPSTRLSTDEALPSLAAVRQTEPRKLMALLRGELDWVVMKCLEKQRDRRYETANGLARDIQRYLADEPVEARPPSAGYRLRKFLRRNKGAVLAVSLLTLALVGGIAGTTYGMLRAQQRSIEAEEARGREAERARGERQAREQEAEQRAKAERARNRAWQALDAMTSSVTGDSLTTQKEVTEEQKQFLVRVLSYYQEFAGEKADDEPSRARTARAAHRVGTIEYRLGRKKEAATAIRLGLDRYANLAADFPAVPEYRQGLALSHDRLGILLTDQAKLHEAQAQIRQALGIRGKLVAEVPREPMYRQELASSHTNLGVVLKELGKHAEAEQQYRQAVVIAEKLVADFPTRPEYRPDLADCLTNLAELLPGLEAEKQIRKALAIREKLVADFPGSPLYRQRLARSLTALGNLQKDLGKLPEAQQQHQKARAICEKLAALFPAVPQYRHDLATSLTALVPLLKDLGKRDEAEKHCHQALAIWEPLVVTFPTVPQYRHSLASVKMKLAHLRYDARQYSEAETLMQEALATQEKLAADFSARPEYRLDLASSRSSLANVLFFMEKRPAAEAQYRLALPILEKLTADFPTIPRHRLMLAQTQYSLGTVLAMQGKLTEAQAPLRQALAIREKLAAEFPNVPAYRGALADSCTVLGNLLVSLGKQGEGQKQYHRAVADLEKLMVEVPNVPGYQLTLGGCYCNLGRLHLNGGEPAKCLEWFDKAIRTLAALYRREPQLAEAGEFLRNSYVGRASAHDLLHRYADAVQDWGRVLALSPRPAQPIVRVRRARSRVQAGQVAEGVAEVAALTKVPSLPGAAWYDFACVYALASGKSADSKQEYADRAMQMLHKAVKAGYRDTTQMKKDRNLDSLRPRKDFKELLEELEKKSAAGSEKQP